MRTIKFRAKNRGGDWCYGDLFLHCKHPNIKRIGNGNRSTYIVPDTIGQYTGLIDRNGKEIYEGDVVNIHDSHETCGLIYYNSQKAAYLIGRQFVINKDKKKGDCFDYEINGYRASQKYEIIGNKWDNPELLKTKA